MRQPLSPVATPGAATGSTWPGVPGTVADMASLQTLERRISQMRRNSVELKLNVDKVMENLGVAAATSDEVDAAIDDE